MFSNFYQLDLHKQTCVALANLWKHQQQLNWKRKHLLSYGYHKCIFDDSLIEYIGPPNLCLLFSVE